MQNGSLWSIWWQMGLPLWIEIPVRTFFLVKACLEKLSINSTTYFWGKVWCVLSPMKSTLYFLSLSLLSLRTSAIYRGHKDAVQASLLSMTYLRRPPRVTPNLGPYQISPFEDSISSIWGRPLPPVRSLPLIAHLYGIIYFLRIQPIKFIIKDWGRISTMKVFPSNLFFLRLFMSALNICY